VLVLVLVLVLVRVGAGVAGAVGADSVLTMVLALLTR
jgi:hypothetical protein